jgi:threonine dehydrogenase-like Zn-dependent dehydrogenase
MIGQNIRPPTPNKVKYNDQVKIMTAQFNGKDSIKVVESPLPIVTDPTDAVVKVTATTVCGSDLHLYHNEIPLSKKGDIMGHECVGIVESIGPDVIGFKKGDRVVVSSVISCGKCNYCQRGEWSCCDTTNTNKAQREIYGHNLSGIFGYSTVTGSYDGCQAEYVRVPFADVNLFKIPDNIPDNQALLIADSACTGYHGTELAGVQAGDSVVVFGCGPIGLMTMMWCKFKKAGSIVAIDVDGFRLNFAMKKFGAIPINSTKDDPIKEVRKLFKDGPDRVIDCVGFRFPEGMLHKVERALMLETDSPNIINTAIEMVRKNGTIALIGDYIGYCNHFNIGAFMEKHLTMRGGQLWPHKYYNYIFECIQLGLVDPSVILTHVFPLSKIDEVYIKFDKHEDGLIKPLVIPDYLMKKGERIL